MPMSSPLDLVDLWTLVRMSALGPEMAFPMSSQVMLMLPL